MSLLEKALKLNKKPEGVSVENSEELVLTKQSKRPITMPKGRVFGFFGDRGTGKTYACVKIAEEFGKTLWIDTEWKANEVITEKFPQLKFNIKEPLKDDKKKHSEIFKDDADIHIDVAYRMKPNGQRDDVASAKYIIDNMPIYLALLQSRKYKNLVIDSTSPIREFAYTMWLVKERKLHPERERPSKFEYPEIEAIIQDILFPFVNFCKLYGVNLILTAGIAGNYIKDTQIGYKEDAKQWLLGILSYEIWFERDYKKYVIKHPYKPFWCLTDKDENIAEYLFNKDFIDNAEEKDFEDFKYESLTSETLRLEEKAKKTESIKIG